MCMFRMTWDERRKIYITCIWLLPSSVATLDYNYLLLDSPKYELNGHHVITNINTAGYVFLVQSSTSGIMQCF